LVVFRLFQAIMSPSDATPLNGFHTPEGSNGAKRLKTGPTSKEKSLILNAFVEMCKECSWCKSHRMKKAKRQAGSGHQSPGLWRHPEDQSHRFNDLDYWTSLAQTLEKAKFHGIFIADVLGMLSKKRPEWT
jgi:hypothetical protein